MATIRREMGHFGVTAVFHVEFEKLAYRQTGIVKLMGEASRPLQGVAYSRHEPTSDYQPV